MKGEPVNESDYGFAGAEAAKYEELFFGSEQTAADVYELYPKFEKDKDGSLSLRVFLRIDLDEDRELDSAARFTGEEDLIFLLLNNSKEEQTARIYVDDNMTGLIDVAPRKDVVLESTDITDTTEEVSDGPAAADMDAVIEPEGVIVPSDIVAPVGGAGGGASGAGSGSSANRHEAEDEAAFEEKADDEISEAAEGSEDAEASEDKETSYDEEDENASSEDTYDKDSEKDAYNNDSVKDSEEKSAGKEDSSDKSDNTGSVESGNESDNNSDSEGNNDSGSGDSSDKGNTTDEGSTSDRDRNSGRNHDSDSSLSLSDHRVGILMANIGDDREEGNKQEAEKDNLYDDDHKNDEADIEIVIDQKDDPDDQDNEETAESGADVLIDDEDDKDDEYQPDYDESDDIEITIDSYENDVDAEIQVESEEDETYITVEADSDNDDVIVDAVVTIASESDAAKENVYTFVEGEVLETVIVKKKNRTFAGVAYIAKLADILTPAGGDTLVYEGENYTVEITYDDDALLPYGVSLKVSEYEKDSDIYRERILEAAEDYGWDGNAIIDELDVIDLDDLPGEEDEESLNKESAEDEIFEEKESEENETYYIDKVRIFDISLYVDDEIVEPAAEVEVEFTFEDQEDEAEYRIIHFLDEEENQEIDARTIYEGNTQTVAFSVSGFSDFAVIDNGIMPLADTDLSIVSAFNISSYTDGTEPFDTTEGTGNDTGANNGIVRSFDNIGYTLGFTTTLKDSAGGSIEDAYMMVEFTLPVDPSIAVFDMSTLNWCLEPVVTYYYSDDTSNTTWDTGKTVTKQVLTGRRHLNNTTSDQPVIPGSGSLSAGISVKSAPNDTEIQPVFTVYMEGNDESEARSVTAEAVKVTAAPKYNIRLYRNSLCDALGYFNLDSGTMSTTKSSDSDVYGRIEGYGIVVQLYNDSADKGLKGVELPAGEITFDVSLTTTVNNNDMTQSEGYHPLLWDYEEATAESASKKGKLSRTMAAFGVSRASYAYLTPGNLWRGTTRSTDRYCYDGGGWSITQNDDYSLSVKLDGSYLFDTENFIFPEYGLGDTTTTPRFAANIGGFSAGYMQILATFPEDAAQGSTQNFTFAVEVKNMSMTSASGQQATEEMISSDNKSSETLSMYPSGSITKWNWYRKENRNGLDNNGSSQNGSDYAYQGAKIQIASEIKYTGDTPLTGYNFLQKFDDEALVVVPTEGTGYSYYSNVNSNSTYDSINVLYAAKPDGTGWSSDTEMMAAKEENLIYFESLDALENAGCICIGILYEIRGTFYAMPGTGNYIYMMMQVLDTAQINCVYQTVNTLRAWQQGYGNPMSWTEVYYDSIEGAYGWGNTSWTGTSTSKHDDYHDGYTAPTFIASHEEDYVKTSYDNGVKSGHTNANQAGDSMLVIGDKTTVSIVVNDTTETSTGSVTTKTVYDLDQGERTVTYKVTPQISVAASNQYIESSDDTDNVTLTVTLPKGLSYDYGSAEIEPDRVTVNADGTTTIIWKYADVKIATDSLSSFTFTCTIGAAGTVDDVENNDTLTIKAEITSDKDSREYMATYGNVSETTISVVRLASSSISKTVECAYSDIGEEITFHLHYGNTSDSYQLDDELLDILPYNGDGRGSSFSGSYQISKVMLDLGQAPNTWETNTNDTVYIEYTKDSTIRGYSEEQIEDLMKGSVETADLEALGFVKLTDEDTADVDNDKRTITWDFSEEHINDVIALYIRLEDVRAYEYVTVSITLGMSDIEGLLKDSEGNTQQPGDTYTNNFYQYYLNEAGVVTSNTATCTVLERELSGLVWVDDNRNGARENDEKLFNGAEITLYRTDRSDYDTSSDSGDSSIVNGVTLYTAYNIMGEEVEPITTSEDGAYKFTLLESGTYYVVISGTDGDTATPTGSNIVDLSNNSVSISEYGLTKKDAASDSIDSDAKATLNSDNLLENAYIELILPSPAEMTGYQYISDNNDAGLVLAPLEIEKVSSADKDTKLAGAVFTLTDTEGNYLIFDNGVYAGTEAATGNEVPDGARLTTDSDGRISVSGLEVGLKATLTEIQAPDGYSIDGSGSWEIEVKIDEQTNSWLSYAYIGSQKIEDSLPFVIENKPGAMLPNTGGSGTLPFRLAGLMLMGGATMLYMNFRRRRAKPGG